MINELPVLHQHVGVVAARFIPGAEMDWLS
jgi:hypothetical protein